MMILGSVIPNFNWNSYFSFKSELLIRITVEWQQKNEASSWNWPQITFVQYLFVVFMRVTGAALFPL